MKKIIIPTTLIFFSTLSIANDKKTFECFDKNRGESVFIEIPDDNKKIAYIHTEKDPNNIGKLTFKKSKLNTVEPGGNTLETDFYYRFSFENKKMLTININVKGNNETVTLLPEAHLRPSYPLPCKIKK